MLKNKRKSPPVKNASNNREKMKRRKPVFEQIGIQASKVPGLESPPKLPLNIPSVTSSKLISESPSAVSTLFSSSKPSKFTSKLLFAAPLETPSFFQNKFPFQINAPGRRASKSFHFRRGKGGVPLVY